MELCKLAELFKNQPYLIGIKVYAVEKGTIKHLTEAKLSYPSRLKILILPKHSQMVHITVSKYSS